MTIKTNGPISLLDIFNEFGGNGPTSISNYYRGGPYVNGAVVASGSAFITPPKGSASGIQLPTGGTIQFSEFYGTTANVYPAAGTVLQSNVCQGYDLGNILADGNGGSYFQVTQNNSASCGYTQPVAVSIPITWQNPVVGSGTSTMITHLTASPQGGTAPYTYEWITDSINGIVTVAPYNQSTLELRCSKASAGEGDFHVIVTDATGARAVSNTVFIQLYNGGEIS